MRRRPPAWGLARGAALPAALLSVATGLVLAHTQTRTARMGAALLILPAMAVALAPLPQLSDDIVFSGAWISLIGTSVWLYREHWIRPGIAGAVALNAGS